MNSTPMVLRIVQGSCGLFVFGYLVMSLLSGDVGYLFNIPVFGIFLALLLARANWGRLLLLAFASLGLLGVVFDMMQGVMDAQLPAWSLDTVAYTLFCGLLYHAMMRDDVKEWMTTAVAKAQIAAT